ncbi:MAG: hypothetical protein ACKOXM_02965 [Agromyces sp.]
MVISIQKQQLAKAAFDNAERFASWAQGMCALTGVVAVIVGICALIPGCPPGDSYCSEEVPVNLGLMPMAIALLVSSVITSFFSGMVSAYVRFRTVDDVQVEAKATPPVSKAGAYE